MVPPSSLPIIAICGHSGSGKTTFIEKLIPFLCSQKVRVAVVKHSSKCVAIDRPGKDSDRFYQAGASVYFVDNCQEFFRTPRRGDESVTAIAYQLLEKHDYVIVEGFKNCDLPKIWLLGENEDAAAESAKNVLAVYQPRRVETEQILRFVEGYLRTQWMAAPLAACVLIGGKSSRMGRAKHLIEKDGCTWLEIIGNKLAQVTDRVVVVGQGRLPRAGQWPQLVDAPGVQGPLAGIVAALRWSPRTSFIVSSCDLPLLQTEALSWLCEQRRPGKWAILPEVVPGRTEPLLAYYDFRARSYFEKMILAGVDRLSTIGDMEQSDIIRPPSHLQGAWYNCNSLEDAKKIKNNL